MVTIHGVSSDSKYFEKDDYYTKGKGDSAGVWTYGEDNLNRTTGIDLNGIDKEGFFKTLTEEGVGSDKLVGKDLTFSAPKSVSIAWAMSDDKDREAILSAQEKAVEETLNYIKDNTAVTRQTQNGITETVKANGITAINFNHLLSRDKDPQLHTHSIVLNITQRETDGSLRALDYDSMMSPDNLHVYDSVYKNALARELEKQGYTLVYDKDGKNFEISGLDDEKTITAFSSREQAILEYARENGLDMSNSEDRNKAILQTRPNKEHANIDELTKEWQKKAQSLSLSNDLKENKQENPAIDKEHTQQVVAEAARQELSLSKGVFNKQDFVKNTLETLNAQRAQSNLRGLYVTAQDVEKEFNSLVKKGDILYLGSENAQGVYTSKEFIQAERNIIDASQKEKEAFLTKEQYDNLSKGFFKEFEQKHGFALSYEQKEAVRMIYTSDRQIVGIQGYAGTGKSALFAAVNEFSQYVNAEVRGLAPTGQAAKVLEQDSGFKSTTIHKALNSVERYGDMEKGQQKTGKFSDPEINKHWWDTSNAKKNPQRIIVMDEAGMADARLMANVINMADRMNAKLVLSGDISQFQSVGSGKAFDLMQRRGLKTSFITNIKRQKNKHLKGMAKEIATGDSTKAYNKLKNNGNISVYKENKQAYRDIKDNFLKDYTKNKNTYVIVGTNKQKNTLNQLIRDSLVKKGLVDKESVKIKVVTKDTTEKFIAKGEKVQKGQRQYAEKEFAKGDRIVFLKNDNLQNKLDNKRFAVKNGNVGYIKAIDKDNNTITVDINGKNVKLSLDTYKNIDHAYAITAHKSQGSTIDHVHSLMDGKDKTLNRNSFYVHLTRTKETFKGYVLNEHKLKEKIVNWQHNKSAIEAKERLDNSPKSSRNFIDNTKSSSRELPGNIKSSTKDEKDFFAEARSELKAILKDLKQEAKGMTRMGGGSSDSEIENKGKKKNAMHNKKDDEQIKANEKASDIHVALSR